MVWYKGLSKDLFPSIPTNPGISCILFAICFLLDLALDRGNMSGYWYCPLGGSVAHCRCSLQSWWGRITPKKQSTWPFISSIIPLSNLPLYICCVIPRPYRAFPKKTAKLNFKWKIYKAYVIILLNQHLLMSFVFYGTFSILYLFTISIKMAINPINVQHSVETRCESQDTAPD